MNSKALIRAATITIAWVAAATICSELFSTFKELLTSVGGHHWIGKSLLSAIFFGLLYLFFARITRDRFSFNDTLWLLGTVVLSGLAILLFYIQHA